MRRPALQTLFSLTALGLVACGPPALVGTDVSFLVPLEQARGFLAAPTLLPRPLFDQLHPLTVVDEPDDLYATLSVVAVRFDACFLEGGDTRCRPQVRLVLQPIFDGPDGPTTRDAAVHLFFSTTEAEIVGAVRALAQVRAQRSLSMPEALATPHPGFADPSWTRALAAQLGPLTEARRLERVTSMSVHASNLAWIFSGMDLVAGETRTIPIPTLGGTREHHVTSTGGSAAPEVTLDPAPAVEGPLVPVLAPGGLASATPEALAAAATAVQRLEDPVTHNPGTVDCGSCHVAALAQRALTRHGVPVDTSAPASSAFDDTRNLRAFGYFFRAPAVSPRVQRETALVRDDFTRRLER